ncbi:MAG: redoxin domain-containing protein [Acidobacteria bacterium OLB17]|nr:MAG: redoxin domain-containing protein [Acidobacteria bacterium OLB17]MCZ2390943.1 TlpA family protein disulfide reductase [Acidobacteriota bacterium]
MRITRSLLFLAIFVFASTAFGQGNVPVKRVGPKVLKVSSDGLKRIIRPLNRPMVINFWATWCDPCRDEFPELVKLHQKYRAKVDFITISLDDLAEIDRDVPKFLAEMHSEMPAYLLKAVDENDENAAYRTVSDKWAGNLPLTLVKDDRGFTTYERNGRFRTETLEAEINKVIALADAPIYTVVEFVKFKEGLAKQAEYFYENNWRLYREEAKKRNVIASFDMMKAGPEAGGTFDLILVTRYRGKEQFDNSEKGFEPILKELRPNGPALLDGIKPKAFRETVFVYRGREIPSVK